MLHLLALQRSTGLRSQFGQFLAQFGSVNGSLRLRLRLGLGLGLGLGQEAGTVLLVHEPMKPLAFAIAILHRLALGALLVRFLGAAGAAVVALVLKISFPD